MSTMTAEHAADMVERRRIYMQDLYYPQAERTAKAKLAWRGSERRVEAEEDSVRAEEYLEKYVLERQLLRQVSDTAQAFAIGTILLYGAAV